MSFIIEFAKIIFLLFSTCLVALYFFQGKMIFYPQKISGQARQNFKEYDITIESQGVLLHGWFVNRGVSFKKPLIIYYGGNAEEVSCNLLDMDKINTDSFLFMNYRGYGESQGRPGEENLLNDALNIFDYIVNKENIAPEHIVLMGRSIGTGVACHVAHKRKVASLILVTPFDSLVNVAKKHYPIFPVNYLLKHRFESMVLAPAIKRPMLAVIGTSDDIIPNKNSLNLVEQWAGPVTIVLIENASHNDISMYDRYWTSINDFLKSIK